MHAFVAQLGSCASVAQMSSCASLAQLSSWSSLAQMSSCAFAAPLSSFSSVAHMSSCMCPWHYTIVALGSLLLDHINPKRVHVLLAFAGCFCLFGMLGEIVALSPIKTLWLEAGLRGQMCSQYVCQFSAGNTCS